MTDLHNLRKLYFEEGKISPRYQRKPGVTESRRPPRRRPAPLLPRLARGHADRSSLSAYAAGYAPFIESIELGWRTLGEHGHADAERAHAGLWARFREALGPASGASCAEARALAEQARLAFADPAECVGALYAFEAQQPSTAESKLEGLRRHYRDWVPEAAAEYFRLHAGELQRAILRERADALPAAGRAAAQAACERLCKAMWCALSGVMRGDAPEPARHLMPHPTLGFWSGAGALRPRRPRPPRAGRAR